MTERFELNDMELETVNGGKLIIEETDKGEPLLTWLDEKDHLVSKYYINKELEPNIRKLMELQIMVPFFDTDEHLMRCMMEWGALGKFYRGKRLTQLQ